MKIVKSAQRFPTGGSFQTDMPQQFDTWQNIPPTCSGNEYKGGSRDDGDHLTQAIHKLQPRGIQVHYTVLKIPSIIFYRLIN